MKLGHIGYCCTRQSLVNISHLESLKTMNMQGEIHIKTEPLQSLHVIRKHSELQYIKGKHTHTPHMHTDRYAHLHKHTYTTNANRKHTHTDTYEHTYRHAYKPTEGRRVILSYYNYSWTFPVCLDRMKELNSSTLRDW